MLVIRRRRGETLVIGDNVEIEVLDAGGSSVKLGIRAPREIAIVRKEILVTGAQNQAAARESSPDAIKNLLAALQPAGSRPHNSWR
jgi:carbon storage regulator